MVNQILLVDSHHGVYCAKILVVNALPNLDQEFLPCWTCTPEQKAEIEESLKAGPDNENYWEAAMDIENGLEYVYRDQTWYLYTVDGDIWLIEKNRAAEWWAEDML